jgi:hypothetical protein
MTGAVIPCYQALSGFGKDIPIHTGCENEQKNVDSPKTREHPVRRRMGCPFHLKKSQLLFFVVNSF